MKKLYSLLMILAMVATFSACSKEDTPELPKSKSATAIKTQQMDGVTGGKGESEIVITKSDFTNIQDIAKYVRSGDVQSSSNIKVFNVSVIDKDNKENGAKFSDVKLTIKGSNPVKVLDLGEIEKTETYEGFKMLSFLQDVLDEVVDSKKGKSTLVLTYKIDNKGVKPSEMEIKLDAKFGF